MSLTTEQKQGLADKVYNVDSSKDVAEEDKIVVGKDYPYSKIEGRDIGSFHVIAKEEDTVNGFQAMATVPIIDGAPDYSDVTISYAGTNPSDPKGRDLLTDVQTVVSNSDKFGFSYHSQLTDAKNFADRVYDEVQSDYPDANFSVTSHSLGGFLSMYVAAENHWPAVTFNAPDAWHFMSPQAREWIQKNPDAFYNYVNAGDPIGTLGNKTGASHYYHTGNKRVPGLLTRLIIPFSGIYFESKSMLEYHDLMRWEFEGNTLKNGKSVGGPDPLAAGIDAVTMYFSYVGVPAPLWMLPIAGKDGYLSFQDIFNSPKSLAKHTAKLLELSKSMSGGTKFLLNEAFSQGLRDSLEMMKDNLREFEKVNREIIPDMEEKYEANKYGTFAVFQWILDMDDIVSEMNMRNLQVSAHVDEGKVADVSQKIKEELEELERFQTAVNTTIQLSKVRDALEAQRFQKGIDGLKAFAEK